MLCNGRIASPFGIDSLDKSDEVRIDVEVSRHRALSGLGGCSMHRLEEGRLVQPLRPFKSC